MRNEQRSTLAIQADILKCITEGDKKLTHIMFCARLATKLTKSYLSSMESLGLIKRVGDIMTLTANGVKYLELFTDFKARLKSIGIEIHTTRDFG